MDSDSPGTGGNGIHGGVLYNLLRLYSAAQQPPSLNSNFSLVTSSNTHSSGDQIPLSRVGSSQSSTDNEHITTRITHARPLLGGRTQSSQSDSPMRSGSISINPFRPSHRVARSLDCSREETIHPIYGKIGRDSFQGSTETIVGDAPPPSFDVASTRKPLFNFSNRSEISGMNKLNYSDGEDIKARNKRTQKDEKKAAFDLRHSITLHVTDILIRQDFVLKLGRALMRYRFHFLILAAFLIKIQVWWTTTSNRITIRNCSESFRN